MDFKSGNVFWKSGSRQTERTVPSDAECSCWSFRLHALMHDQSSNTGTQPTRSRMAEARGLNETRLQGYEASEWKEKHQAHKQWGIADGNDTTPREVDALMFSLQKKHFTFDVSVLPSPCLCSFLCLSLCICICFYLGPCLCFCSYLYKRPHPTRLP